MPSSSGDVTITNHRSFDSYGNIISQTNSAVDHFFGFSGRAFDVSTGLQNNLHRWYDPSTGQWLTEDPIGFAAGDANIRRYVGNSPTNFADATGQYSVEFGVNLTPAQKNKLAASLGRIQKRLPALIKEVKVLYNAQSACEKELQVSDWLRKMNNVLGKMQTNLAGTGRLGIYNEPLGAQGPLAKSWPPGGDGGATGRFYIDRVTFNMDGTNNWDKMTPAELDALFFHELLHLAGKSIKDEDARFELDNAHSIQNMINTGIAGNTFYARERKKALERCKK